MGLADVRADAFVTSDIVDSVAALAVFSVSEPCSAASVSTPTYYARGKGASGSEQVEGVDRSILSITVAQGCFVHLIRGKQLSGLDTAQKKGCDAICDGSWRRSARPRS